MDIKIIVNNIEMTVSKGISLEELSKKVTGSYKYEIIVAKVDGIYTELTEIITKECNIEFFDLMDRGANEIYLNGLIMLTVYAFRKLFGSKSNIKVKHSLDKGLYIEPSISLTKEDITKLENYMQDVVMEDLPIQKLTVSRLETIDYFNKIGYKTKADLMKYNTSTHLTLYKLGNLYDYFYSLMPISTKVLSHFELTYLDEKGFVLRFPTVFMDDGIKKFERRYNIFNLHKESREWANKLDLTTVVDLNKKVSSGKIDELIKIDELNKNNELMELAKKIISNPKTKVVLLAGPSSTGKTTTTNKLTLCLKSLGKNPLMLSMDDFFVEREETPKDENGKLDFERLEAVDLKLFEDTIKKLLDNEQVTLPTFNFILGKKEYNKILKLEENSILLIEGIHALNPKVLEHIPKANKACVYLSALNELNVDDHVRISTTDNRLLRRIIRDNRTRGRSVEDTLADWPNVRKGEEEYIFPYQDEADYTFNTAMIYELGVLKTFVEPLLYSVDPDSEYYNEAIRLLNFLRLFLPIPSEEIPKDSILREFIGGGCFKV